MELISKETLNSLVEKIDKALNDAGVWCTSVYTYDQEIMADIDGDWKHDHLRSNYVIGDILIDAGLDYSFYEDVTEEGDSDCYSAIHRYTLKKVA